MWLWTVYIFETSYVDPSPPFTYCGMDCFGQFFTKQGRKFWGRWRREYVYNIATRQRWHTPRRNLKVGDIVMEKTEDQPRNEWKLAKVVETVTDKDGLVRRVKIRVGDQKIGKEGQRSGKPSIVERPVQKLILLLETV
ncbi:hypothetical protein N1851_012317 [Merluccius polli]|uniref:DUF5641 domain-containing protein n=1 Tax=Merluccius polli TaxID=89951 RepID=A0AA47P2A6_MERPO|nr:hypothetical protein N1851_012317 [Merluccius polli]